jgi:ATP-binding cassette, subfamily B, bacterial
VTPTKDVGIRASIRALWPYFRPYPRLLVLIGLGLLVEAAFNVFLPLSFSILIDKALIPKDKQVLVIVLVALGLGVVITGVVGVARDRLYARLTASVIADLRHEIFAHLQKLSLGFFARMQLGDVLARFSGDLVALEGAFVSALAWAVAPALDVCVYTVVLFLLDWRLALVAMLVWPIALLGPRYFAPRAVSGSYEKKQLESQTLSVVQENISGQSVVKAFGLEDAWLASFEERNAGLRRTTAHVSFLSSLVERSAYSGVLALDVAIIGIGSWLSFNGSLSIGKLVAFQGVFLALGYGLAYVTQYMPGLVQGLGGFRHISELFEQEPQVVDAAESVPLPRLRDEIRFDGVTFGYSEPDANLHDLSVSFAAGESVAFVGSSGSGKSTALSLVMRFYDPWSGSVTFDGHDLRGVTSASLRSQFGVVFQESFLFNTTVRENIRMGKPDATDAEVEAAAGAAEIHEFVVGQPDGYDTVVGERGGRLSGGQRQRLAIARAILRDPAILVLDEATSALDPGTEAAINATLERVAEGRTTITVTHRLAVAKGADRIFVLDQGRLVESGRHDELVAAPGLYQELWRRQSGFTVEADGDRAVVSPERLAEVPILSGVEPELLARIAELFTSEQYPARRVVVQEGDPGDRFYLVVRGRLIATRKDADGNAVQVNVHEDGDHFGEIALLRKANRLATVTTETPALLLSLAREPFLELIESAPHVRESMDRIIDEYLAAWAARHAGAPAEDPPVE